MASTVSTTLLVVSLIVNVVAASSSQGFVLDLIHRDFANAVSSSSSSLEDRLAHAINRSRARLERIQHLIIRSLGFDNSTRPHVAAHHFHNAKPHTKACNNTGGPNGMDNSNTETASEAACKAGSSNNGEEASEVDVDVESGDSTAQVTGFASSIVAGDGAFLTNFFLGTPLRNVTAILDTGSDLVWQQCSPCDACFSQPNPIFDPSLSSSYKPAFCADKLCRALAQTPCAGASSACTYTYAYGDSSSTSGNLAYDTLTLLDESGVGRHIEGFAFGCGHANQGRSFATSDGLLGLGQGPLSLPSQISLSKFSYCLGPVMSAARSPLFLGDTAKLDKSPRTQATPLITNPAFPTFYYVNLKGISLNGMSVALPEDAFSIREDGTGGLIIDTGTTITYLQVDAYEAVLDVVRSHLAEFPAIPRPLFGLDLCYFDLPLEAAPTLTLHFENADFPIPPSNMFFHIAGLSCVALGASRGISILGNIQQQNYHILYDRSSKRVFFNPTTCSTMRS